MNNIIKFTPGSKTIIADKIYAPDFDLQPGDIVEFVKSEPIVGAPLYEEEYPNSEPVAVYLKLVQCDDAELVGEVGWFCADELTGELFSCYLG